MIALALLFALQAVPGPEQAPSYEALVALGVTRGRQGDLDGAEAALTRAVRLDPARPEGRVELAGLRFLQGRHAEAAAELQSVLSRRDDAYVRDLLASSLHLAGRGEEALDHWNRQRRPVLRNIHLLGLHHTRSRLVVPELVFQEGAVLTRAQVAETRLRLQETGAFRAVAMRTVPLERGQADVEVALVEKRGLGSPLELAALSISKALQRTAWLRYENLAGAGIALGASYRWQETQPRAAVSVDWARPLGLGARLRAEGSWERPQYQLDGERLTMRARGAQVGLRRVLDARTTGELRWRGRRRTFSAPREQASDGLISGLELGLERRMVVARRFRFDGALHAFGAAAALGSDVGFLVGRASLAATLLLDPPEASMHDRSTLAARLTVGRGSAATPLDAMFAPGAASEMEYPLRAHRQKSQGVLGRTTIGRSLTLLNVEWRRQWLRWGPLRAGTVLFYDGARVDGTISRSAQRIFHDLGAGLRVGVGDVILRLDYGRSAHGPGGGVLSAGLGPTF